MRRNARAGTATPGAAGGGTAPGKRDLADMLGRATALWERLRAGLEADHGPLAERWSFSKTTGRWSVQLKRKDRAVVYLVPQPGHIIASFALGEKACAAAKDSGLPASVLGVIESAPRYPEGRGVRLDVRSGGDVANVVKVASIKMAC